MTIETFEQFLGSMPPQQFLEGIYSFRPCHIEGRRDRFAYLLTWEVLNNLLYTHSLQPPRLRLAREGEIIGSEKYMQESGIAGRMQLKAAAAWELFQKGTTLVINQIEEMHPPIRALSRMLERTLCDYVSVNIYASWHATQGFSTHWDDHEVIIVQVDGVKRWSIFKPERQHPLPDDPKTYGKAPDNSLYWEGELHAGDLLHIPRGYWHHAIPLPGERTLHLTLTIPRKNGLDLGRTLIGKLRDNEILRADVPRLATPEVQRVYLETFRTAVMELLRDLTLPAYYRELDVAAPAQMRPSLPWLAAPEGVPIPPAAWLHWRPPRKVGLRDKNDKVVLDALKAEITFETAAAPVILDLESSMRLRFADLCAHHTRIEPEELQRFIVDLVSKGLVSISESAEI